MDDRPRTAWLKNPEFARRSQARFRYLQETTSENRARVQAFFETLNRHFSGRRVAEVVSTGAVASRWSPATLMTVLFRLDALAASSLKILKTTLKSRLKTLVNGLFSSRSPIESVVFSMP